MIENILCLSYILSVNYKTEEIRKNILKPLCILEEDIRSAHDLYNDEILNRLLNREKHTKLHQVFLRILGNSKTIADRLKIYNKEITQFNKIANGYSHDGDFSFHYYYEGGESICNHQDVAPFYIENETFDPETALDRKISIIKIIIPLQKGTKKSNDRKKDNLEYEINEFINLLHDIAKQIRSIFSH